MHLAYVTRTHSSSPSRFVFTSPLISFKRIIYTNSCFYFSSVELKNSSITQHAGNFKPPGIRRGSHHLHRDDHVADVSNNHQRFIIIRFLFSQHEEARRGRSHKVLSKLCTKPSSSVPSVPSTTVSAASGVSSTAGSPATAEESLTLLPTASASAAG